MDIPAAATSENSLPLRPQAAPVEKITEGVPVSSAVTQQSLQHPPQPLRSSTLRVGGPSFLGLNDVDEPGLLDDEISDNQSNDDMYKTHWGMRIFFVFAVIVVVAALGFLQWRSNHPLQASTPAVKTSNQVASNSGAQNQNQIPQPTPEQFSSTNQNIPKPSNANAGLASPQTAPPLAPQPSPLSGAAAAASSDTIANQTAAQPGSTFATKTDSTKSAIAEDTGASDSAKKTSNQDESVNTGKDSLAGSVEPRVTKSAKNTERDSEAPVHLAETYLQGKGVPQNCDEALGILRTATNRGNTRAQIKLGALYATGECVPMDRVTAYHYFTRALESQPNNVWLDQNRSALWANMNDIERKQAMETENAAR